MKKCLKCITFQKINKCLFFTLILVALFYILSESIFGFNYNDTFSEISIISFFFNEKGYRHHRLIESIFNYSAIFLLGLISFLIEKFFCRKREETIERSNLEKSLIYNDRESPNINKCSCLKISLIIILWVANENLITIFGDLLKDLDFWFSELIFLSILLRKDFFIKIYTHQLFAMLFINVICSPLKLYTIFSSICSKSEDKLYVKILYLIPIGFLVYLILYFVRAFTITKIKWFMEIKFISHTALLTFYGFVGALFSAGICVFTTYFSCNEIFRSESFAKDICFFNSKENKNEYYFDSFRIYFNNFEEYKIFLIISEAFLFFGYKYSCIFLIKKYNPVCLIFTFPIIFFLEKIFLIINTLIISHTFFDETKENISSKTITFFFDITGDIFSFLGFMIYLEIIVIHCLGLDYNIKNNIENRGIENYKKINDINDSQYVSIINDDDEE